MVCACVCVSAQGRSVRICMCICVCCEQSLSNLFYFAGHTAPPVHNTGHPVSTDSYRPGVSRPVKSRSYRHSDRTDSIHRCCYECYQRSQFIEDNAEPSFLPGINSLCHSSPRTKTMLFDGREVLKVYKTLPRPLRYDTTMNYCRNHMPPGCSAQSYT